MSHRYYARAQKNAVVRTLRWVFGRQDIARIPFQQLWEALQHPQRTRLNRLEAELWLSNPHRRRATMDLRRSIHPDLFDELVADESANAA